MNSKLKTMDADTLLSTPLRKTQFIVNGLISQGVHLLCGASKIGKSWLMLKLCLQVALGEPTWELQTHQCTVLYLCLEDTFNRIQNRLYELTDNAPNNLHFAVMSNKIGGGLEEQIVGFLEEHIDTKFIVIDTLQKIRNARASIGANGMYGCDYEDISAIKNLANQYKLSIVLVHHLRKLEDNADPFNQVSGTTGITGAVDSTFVLKKDNRSTDTAKLLVTGRDIEYQEFTLRFRNKVWELVERKSSEEIKAEETPQFLFELVNLMADKTEWKGSATQLLSELNQEQLNPNSVTKLLSRFYYDVLEPNGIRYTTRRTGKCREITLTRSDGNDANDGKSYI